LDLRLGTFEGLTDENRTVTSFGSNPNKEAGFFQTVGLCFSTVFLLKSIMTLKQVRPISPNVFRNVNEKFIL